MTFGKFYEHCIVSLVCYMISEVFLSDLLLHNLKAECDAWEVLRMLYRFST